MTGRWTPPHASSLKLTARPPPSAFPAMHSCPPSSSTPSCHFPANNYRAYYGANTFLTTGSSTFTSARFGGYSASRPTATASSKPCAHWATSSFRLSKPATDLQKRQILALEENVLQRVFDFPPPHSLVTFMKPPAPWASRPGIAATPADWQKLPLPAIAFLPSLSLIFRVKYV